MFKEVKEYLSSKGLDLTVNTPPFLSPQPSEVVHGMEVRFNSERVDHALRVIGALRHTKGRWAGKPLVLNSTQIAYIIAPLFGYEVYDPDLEMWVRLYRDAFIEMPRKNAKSTLASAIAMLLAFGEGEPGAEVMLGAASRDQAGACFKPLKALVDNSPALAKAGIRSLVSSIKQDRTGSVISVASSRGDLAHGANLHGSICDELHVHKDLSLLEAMETGTGARAQPLTMVITTADDGSVGTPYDQRRHIVDDICVGNIEAPRSYCAVWCATREDDPWSEDTWRKANPLYPVSPSRAFLQSLADKAKNDPVAKASFLRLHLGIRSKLVENFIPLDSWDADSREDMEYLDGQACYGGLDLAAVSDLTALVWVFPHDNGDYSLVHRFFVPEDAMPRLNSSTWGNADIWAESGQLTVTPGNVTDYDFVKSQIAKDAEKYNVQAIGVDPWNATQVNNDLLADGYRVELVRQGFLSMSGPMKEIQRLSKSESAHLYHPKSSLMRWQVDNVRPVMDAAGNVKPGKSSSKNKIDGFAALVNAMYVAINRRSKVSAYDTQGVESI